MAGTMLRWIKDFWRGKNQVSERLLDEAVFSCFSTPAGQRVLSYLIEEHIMNHSVDPTLAEVTLGKLIVVHDLVARMDRFQNQEKYSVKTESQEEVLQ